MNASIAPRPWPAPSDPWVMAQTWSDLLFAHWPLRPEALRPLIPAALPIDIFEGMAWLGVVPFRMSGVRPRLIPAVPWLSAFPELNVRTYVTLDGKPGVWFFSLDAGNPVAAGLGRSVFRLPYYAARMSAARDGEMIRYRSRRVQRGAPAAEFRGVYRPTGAVMPAEAGSLAGWLTARYCLYTTDRNGQLYRAEIVHAPWPLQRAEAEIATNSMAQASGIQLPRTPPVLHFSRHLDVRVWPLRRIRGPSS